MLRIHGLGISMDSESAPFVPSPKDTLEKQAAPTPNFVLGTGRGAWQLDAMMQNAAFQQQHPEWYGSSTSDAGAATSDITDLSCSYNMPTIAPAGYTQPVWSKYVADCKAHLDGQAAWEQQTRDYNQRVANQQADYQRQLDAAQQNLAQQQANIPATTPYPATTVAATTVDVPIYKEPIFWVASGLVALGLFASMRKGKKVSDA